MKTLKAIRRWTTIDSALKIGVSIATVGYMAWAIKTLINDN